MILGAVMALHEDRAKRHRAAVISAFVVLGVAGIVVTLVQSGKSGRETAEANSKLTNSLAGLADASREISRVQQLNTDLQGQLLSSNKTIAGLASRSVQEQIGGDSFPYLGAVGLGNGGFEVAVFSKGKHQSFNVHFEITDLDLFNTLLKSGGLTLSNSGSYKKVIELPYVQAEGRLQFQYHEAVPNGVLSGDFNITILTRNGTFIEYLRLRETNGKWIQAVRVVASYYDGRRGMVLESIDKEFPKQTLDDEWDQVKQKPLQIRDCVNCKGAMQTSL